MKKQKYICTILILLYIFIPPSSHAEIKQEENMSIEIEDINLNSGLPTATPKQKPSPLNNNTTEIPIPQPEFNQTFTFNISNLIIDYGIISATNSIYRSNNLSLSGRINNAQINLYQDHPPTSFESNIPIPDTTCDNGSCSQTTAALWENTLTYGFGYRCENITGNTCPQDFNNKNYYRQLSDTSKNEPPQTIITNKQNLNNIQTQIIYKINTSKTQPDSNYINTITYIATPGY